MKLDELLEQGRSRGKRPSAPMPGPLGKTRMPPVPRSVGTGAASLNWSRFRRELARQPNDPRNRQLKETPSLEGLAGESVQPNDPRFVPFDESGLPRRNYKFGRYGPSIEGPTIGSFYEKYVSSPIQRTVGSILPILGEAEAGLFTTDIDSDMKQRREDAAKAYAEARIGGFSDAEATQKFKDMYPELPSGYWTAVEIAVELALIPAGGGVRTGVRATAQSVPAIIRPFYRAFGETVGAVDTVENAIVGGVIQGALGGTRYGKDAYDVIRMGEPKPPAPGARRLDVSPEAYQQPGLRERIATWREIKRGIEGSTDPREALEAAGLAGRPVLPAARSGVPQSRLVTPEELADRAKEDAVAGSFLPLNWMDEAEAMGMDREDYIRRMTELSEAEQYGGPRYPASEDISKLKEEFPDRFESTEVEPSLEEVAPLAPNDHLVQRADVEPFDEYYLSTFIDEEGNRRTPDLSTFFLNQTGTRPGDLNIPSGYAIQIGRTGRMHGDAIVGASIDHKRKIITLDANRLKEQFAEKAWRNPKIPGVTPIHDNAFQSIGDWYKFVIEHEFAHVKLRNSGIPPGTSQADIENAANRLALEELQVHQHYSERLYRAREEEGWRQAEGIWDERYEIRNLMEEEGIPYNPRTEEAYRAALKAGVPFEDYIKTLPEYMDIATTVAREGTDDVYRLAATVEEQNRMRARASETLRLREEHAKLSAEVSNARTELESLRNPEPPDSVYAVAADGTIIKKGNTYKDRYGNTLVRKSSRFNQAEYRRWQQSLNKRGERGGPTARESLDKRIRQAENKLARAEEKYNDVDAKLREADPDKANPEDYQNPRYPSPDDIRALKEEFPDMFESTTVDKPDPSEARAIRGMSSADKLRADEALARKQAADDGTPQPDEDFYPDDDTAQPTGAPPAEGPPTPPAGSGTPPTDGTPPTPPTPTPPTPPGKNFAVNFFRWLKNKTMLAKAKTWRIQQGNRSWIDRNWRLRRMSNRVRKNKLKGRDVQDTAESLEYQMDTQANWQPKAQRIFRILIRSVNKETPDLTLKEISDYAYLKSEQDQLLLGKYKNKKISPAQANELGRMTQVKINRLIERLPPEGRAQLEKGLGIWDKFVDDMRKDMVFSGRMNQSVADDLRINQPHLNPLRSHEDMAKIRKLKELPDGPYEEWLAEFQTDIAYTVLANTNNNLKRTAILTGLQDTSLTGYNRPDAKALDEHIRQVANAEAGIDTVTIYNAGVKQTYVVPQDFIDVFGRYNEFGFDAKAAKVMGTSANWFRAGATQYNPKFIYRALIGDHINVITMETGIGPRGFYKYGKYQFELIADRLKSFFGENEHSLYQQLDDTAQLTGGVQRRTRMQAGDTGRYGTARGRTRQAEAGGPVQINDGELDRVFSEENIRREAKEAGYRIITTPEEGVAGVFQTMERSGLLSPKKALDIIPGIARKAEYSARITTMLNALDSKFGREAWRKMTPQEIARTLEGQAAAARMVDITINFDRGGTAVKQMNSIIPFLNSSVQGAIQPYRRLFGGPTRRITAQGMATMLTLNFGMTLHHMQYGEDYRNIPSHIRLGTFYWIHGHKTDKNGEYILDANGNRQLDISVYLPRIWNWGPLLAAQTFLMEKMFDDDPSGGFLTGVAEEMGVEVPMWLAGPLNTLETAHLPENPLGAVVGTGMEFGRRTSPLQIEGETPSEIAANAIPLPAAQGALELTINKNFYTGKPIYGEPENPNRHLERAYNVPFTESGGQSGASIVQHVLDSLFGGAADLPVNIIDKIIDLVDDPWTEENMRDFEEYAKLDKEGRARMSRNKTSAWVSTMKRMLRDPDLDGFDLPLLEELGDILKPNRTGSELFYQTADDIKNLTPFSYEDSSAVSREMASVFETIRDGKINEQKKLVANNYAPLAWKRWHEATGELDALYTDKMKALEESNKYPEAYQFSDDPEATVNYLNILATSQGQMKDKRSIGEQVHRMLQSITAEMEVIGLSGMEEAPNIGKLMDDREAMLEKLGPEAREAYEAYREARQITDAEEMWDTQMKVVSDSGYWDAGIPAFKARYISSNARTANERFNLEEKVDTWLDAGSEKRKSLAGMDGSKSDRQIYKSIAQAFQRSADRRRAKDLILRNYPEVLKILISFDYKDEKEIKTGRASSGPRRIVPRLGGIG